MTARRHVSVRSDADGRAAHERIRVAHVATVDMTHRFLLLDQYRRLQSEGFEVTSISAPGSFVPDLEAEGVRHVPWPHATRAWNPSDDVRAFLELIRIFRCERFDIVHTHTPKAGLMGRVGARVAGVPIVVNTVHGYYVTPEHPPARRLPVIGLEWLGARFSDVELFQSAEDLSWALRSRIVRRGRAIRLGNGADLRRFDPSVVPEARRAELRRELGIPEGALVVGTVGRMVAEKGYREFFEVAREVRRAMPHVSFVAVGESDAHKSDAISEEEIAAASDDVIFTGWRTDVVELLALFDVFVLASWREGLPRSAIEAAAMGAPLVLTNIRGCREVVRDGIEGFLVPPRDPPALAGAVSELVRNTDLRRRMGARARERAIAEFDERRVADTVLETYRSLLRSRGSERAPRADVAGTLQRMP